MKTIDTTPLPEELVPLVARHYAMACEQEKIFASVIYKIDRPGIGEMIAMDPRVAMARTVLEFDNALHDANVFSIVIPSDAAITLAIVRDYLRDTTQTKIVFWECSQ
jgi:hypothetical protein